MRIEKYIMFLTLLMILFSPVTTYADRYQKDSNGYYLVDNAGNRIIHEWRKIAGNWQYFGDGGYESIGWKQITGKWYYFNEHGNMLSSQWVGNYYVGDDGAMLTNTTTPDGYRVGADGAWIQGTASSEMKSSSGLSDALDAYGDFMTKKTATSVGTDVRGGYMFKLAYIDEDDIPELVLMLNYGARQDVEIYTYRNGFVVQVLSSGQRKSYSGIGYNVKQNVIIEDFSSTSQVTTGIRYFYIGANGNAVQIHEFYKAVDYLGGDYAHWYIDDKEVGRAYYESEYNVYENLYSYGTFVPISVDDKCYIISGTNIDQMKRNPNSMT